MAKCQGKGFSDGMTGALIRASIKVDSKTDLASTSGLMAEYSQASGKMESDAVQGS
jgi:hypothetical protein